ncbi:hypothetical protein BDV95DRAFT_565287 [Massariosphaeria phaeospora]|uniref:Uncharacterized protein n=1 Tax=Massariosphaeria phaeospora TaxID=100035 RepID=A0A7C8MD42_9PLEO|nr:hypothetical protein BDV95DRAFT_565287 [Massariosphaeria phaeospora]
MASSTSTPRSRSRSSTTSSNSSDTTMPDAPPLTPARPRQASQSQAIVSPTAPVDSRDPAFSLLLSLPRELRDRIYTFALTSPFPFWWPGTASPTHGVAVSLLTVSQQVYDEAAPILYAENNFIFLHPSDCNIFRVISSPYSERITSVYFRAREKELRLWTSYLGSKTKDRSLRHDLPKLKSLWIFLRCGNMPGLMGPIGGGGGGGGAGGGHLGLPHMPQALVAQIQGVQNALGQQVQALQQQVHHLTQTIAAGIGHGLGVPQQGTAPTQPAGPQNAIGNGTGNDNQALPPPPPPAPAQPLHQHPPLPQPHAHGVQNNPPNPGPLTQHMAQQLQIQQQIQLHAQVLQQPLPQPAGAHHPTFNASLQRWEREVGLDSLCLSLQDSRPKDADTKIVCIMRQPRPEVQRLVQRYPDELVVDRNGDARSRFRRLHGIEVSFEVSGFEVPV